MKLSDEQISELSEKVGINLKSKYKHLADIPDMQLTSSIQMLTIEVIEEAVAVIFEYLRNID